MPFNPSWSLERVELLVQISVYNSAALFVEHLTFVAPFDQRHLQILGASYPFRVGQNTMPVGMAVTGGVTVS